MKQWKQVKNKLKEKDELKKYKEKFKHKQIRFVVSKIFFVFNSENKIDELLAIEQKLLVAKKDQKLFSNIIKDFEKIIDYKADWKSFGEFLWMQFQASTYYWDKKKNLENIFNEKNYIKLNSEKRKLYMNWVHSLPKEDDFNEKIIKVSKIIL